jgi:hypothetical protein
MSKETSGDLSKFLTPFPAHVREITLWLREFVWDLYPDSNELIYDNYNALALGWSPTDKASDVFCSIAVYSNHVNFGFNRGSEISDTDKILNGEGSLYRKISIKSENDFPKTQIKKLLKEAHANSLARLKDGKQVLKGVTITKSISAKKRRPQYTEAIRRKH